MSEKSAKIPFRPGDDSIKILADWWKSLENERGERATLRRATSPTEVIFSPAYHQFFGRLRQEGYSVSREGVAAVAGLAAHVKEDAGAAVSLSKQMAIPKAGGASARVSGLRFRRLLAVGERDELYTQMIRVIRLLDGRVNLESLASSIYWWNEGTRKQWAYDYYETAPKEK